MEKPLQELLTLIPEDTKFRVEGVVLKFSKKVHDHLYYFSRLEIRGKVGVQGSRSNIPVSVDVAFPTQVRAPSLTIGKALAARLASWHPILQELKTSTSALRVRIGNARDVLEKYPEVESKAGCLEGVEELVDYLTGLGTLADVIPEILAVCDERLGHFRTESTDEGARVELFWAVIGYLAEAKQIDIEGLTVFVLAHELAHAFVCIGFDATSRRWRPDHFRASDQHLVEALAQYYAVKVIRALQDEIPTAEAAYESLLSEQKRPEFRLHLPWLDEYNPEVVRAALIPMRQKGPIEKIAAFERCMVSEKKRFPVLLKDDPPEKKQELNIPPDDLFFNEYQSQERKRGRRKHSDGKKSPKS